MNDTPTQTGLLLRRARAGDREAADRLITLHRDQLRRMVAARMDDRMAARIDPSDVVQDALAEAVRRLPAYLQGDDDLFYPWLRKIAWERLVQMHRYHIAAGKRSVERECGADLALPDGSKMYISRQLAASVSSPSAIVVRQELQQRIQQRLELLSPQDNEVLVLRHLEQLPMKEAAAVLEVSLAAAQSRYRRALERLHELLSDDSEMGGAPA